jgi:hypothetical protein
MGVSIPHGHLGLDPPEELVEVHAEVLQEDGKGGQRRQCSTVLHGTDQRAGERSPDRRLAETGLQSPPSQLPSDEGGEPYLVVE